MSQINLALHPRQSLAFLTTATELLYGGAAGGGKSHLMRVAAIIWCSEIAGLQIYLFRRLSEDLVKNHMNGPGSFPEILAPWIEMGLVKYNQSKGYLEFWNKSKIWLCHCQHEKDMYKYQGAEIHVLLIDELTHFTEVIYRYLRGRVRLGGLNVPKKYRGLFPRIICGSNPGGVGHTFVRRMFVSISPPMELNRMSEEEGGMLRQYIPAKLEDNPTLVQNDPSYRLKLKGLGSAALVKAMEQGDWDIVAGGALDDVWDNRFLRLPRFVIPQGWRLDRSFDWGSTQPFSVGFWAQADGTEAIFPDGRVFCPRKGSLIRFAEWYGCLEIGLNKGLLMSARRVARGIKERETYLREAGWILNPVQPGPADNSIHDVKEADTATIAQLMAGEGVTWTQSDKSPGSRKIGLQLVRDRIEASKTGELPGIYATANCVATFATLPVLPRDPKDLDDVDTASEDHVYDDWRYRVLKDRKEFANSLKVSHPT